MIWMTWYKDDYCGEPLASETNDLLHQGNKVSYNECEGGEIPAEPILLTTLYTKLYLP
jgi:hypothetical protein